MVFLNPSILFGLLAATIPILIHILNFRKLQKVEFSTLAFLKELQKSKIKKIKIKQWLLLLLRTLIIIFLVLAFARPTLESNYLGSTSSASKSSVVFIIDNSFSMSAIGNNGSVFNKSKTEAKKIISQMQNGDEFFFVLSKDSVLHFTNKKSAKEFLQKFNLTFLTETLESKIRKAVVTLEKTFNINKEIYLFSDFQKSTLSDSIAGAIKINRLLKLFAFDMRKKNANNFSVSNLKLESSILQINKPLEFSTDLHNFSSATHGNITASLFVNNKRVAQQNISLSTKKNKKIHFKTTLASAGLIESKVILEDDDINQDNTNYLTFYVPEQIKILIIYDLTNDIKFLEAALNSASGNNFVVKTINARKQTSINYRNFDIVFSVTDNRKVLKSLAKYVTSGGKVVVIPSSRYTALSFNYLTSNLGYPKVKEIIKTGKTKNDYAEFDYIDFNHPVFKNLFTSKRKNKIESPKVFKYAKTFASSFVKPIITLNDRSIFLGEYSIQKGKILFFNTAIDLSWSNFPFKGIFAPLITKTVFYLSSSATVFNSYTTGQTIFLNTSNITVPQIKVKTPGGIDNIGLEDFSKKTYPYNSTTLPGSYKFYGNNKLIYFADVNTDIKESDLAPASNELKKNLFKKYFGKNYINISTDEDYIKTIQHARYGTELWKPFLLIAFLLALLEIFIARNTKHDMMELNKK